MDKNLEKQEQIDCFVSKTMAKIGLYYYTTYGFPYEMFVEEMKEVTKGWNYEQYFKMVVDFDREHSNL